MDTTPQLKNKKRLIFILIMFVLLFLFLAGWLSYIIVGRGPELQEKAQSQWTKDLSVSAKRGAILDRNYNALAQSASVDTVAVSVEQVIDAKIVADTLAVILDMDSAEIQKRIETAKTANRSEMWIKRQITDEQSAMITAEKERLSAAAKSLSSAEKKTFEKLGGVRLVADTKRYYPNKSFLTQVLGYTTSDGEGQEGIELLYEKYLRGQDGRVVTEKDANGSDIPFADEIYIEATDGYDVVLTVDEVLQSFLEKAVSAAYEDSDAKAASGLAVNPQTGEILALVNIPDFDLNDVPRSDLATLTDLSRNRVVTDVYEPGSTFKIITTASALDAGVVDESSSFTCTGYYTIGDQRIKCWRSYKPHGTQTLTEAVKNSCNPAFMSMALSMGKDTFYDYIHKFGFGQKTGVDLISESSGIVTDKKYVSDADLARIGFGQSIAVTQLQLVMAASAVVNGGYLYEPYIVSELRDSSGKTVEEYGPVMKTKVVSENTSALMNEILLAVVNEGSGKNAAISGYKIGGKTGTAQKYGEDGRIAEGKVIASFLGYASTDDPRIMVLIAVDEPNASVDFGSVIAAPYVKMFLEDALKYLDIEPEGERAKKDKTVPELIGLTVEEAQAAASAAGLDCDFSGVGRVINQMPAAGTTVDGLTVILAYTDTAEEAQPDDDAPVVPDLTGMTVLECMDTLNGLGLGIKVSGAGKAVAQSVPLGEKVQIGEVITVTFERGD